MLEKLDGTPITGQFSARRLREFIPKEGTKLAQEQADFRQQISDHIPQLGEQEGDGENQCDDEDVGRTSGDEDATTGEGGHME